MNNTTIPLYLLGDPNTLSSRVVKHLNAC